MQLITRGPRASIASKHQGASQDAFFVPERRARSSAARDLVAGILGDLAKWEKTNRSRKRARRPADRASHERTVEAILCEAIRLHIIAPKKAIAVGLGKQRRSRYEPLPYEPMKYLLGALSVGLGLLKVAPGYKPEIGWGRRTTFAASAKLVRLAKDLSLSDFGRRAGGEPIVLKATSKRLAQQMSHEVADQFVLWTKTRAELGDQVNYDDSPDIDLMRSEMDRINAALDEADITLEPDIVARSLKTKTVFDPGERWLRRVFHNGHQDMRHGGRLYGGYWINLKKEDRRRGITIDGEPVVELDFRAMMPRLLYAKVGQRFPPDQDPYNVKPIPLKYRDGVKQLFAALLFGTSALKKWPKGCAKKFPPGIMIGDVIAVLRHNHPKVASHFGSLMGFELMRMESDILVQIILSANQKCITVLPIHDGLLCAASRADVVERTMLKSFKAMTGMEGAVGRTEAQSGDLVSL